jgi:hypothetical protein
MWIVSQVFSQSGKRRAGHSGEIKFHLIDVTPAPGFPRLDGPHDGVLGPVEVFRRMLIFGRIAAADVSTRHAQPQVNPRVALFQALCADVSARFHVSNLVHMRAFIHTLAPLKLVIVS